MVMCGSGYSQSQDSLLSKAYEMKSNVLLDKFFENWRMEKTPITDEEYAKLKDAEKDVYDIFYEFYTPKDLSRLRLEDFEYKLYKNVKYFVVEPKIKYRILNSTNYDSLYNELLNDYDSLFISNWKRSKKDTTAYSFFIEYYEDNFYQGLLNKDLFYIHVKKDSINNFRPRISDKTSRLLYFSLDYNNLLSNFIGNDIVPWGTNGIMQTAFADSLSQLKIDFLYSNIFIMASHWGNYWEIQTSPKVFNIDFTNDRKFAKVSYAFPYHQGYSIFEKRNGKWFFIIDYFGIMW